MYRLIATCALACALAAPLAAQVQHVQFPAIPPHNNGVNQIPQAYQFPQHPTGPSPRAIVHGDVDGDVDEDMFVLGSGILLYINGVPDPSAGNIVESVPSPAFGTFVDWTFDSNNQQRVQQVTAHSTDGFLADMDADGDRDLVLCTDAPGGGGIWMLLNTRLTFAGGGIGLVGPLRYVDALTSGWTIQSAPPQRALWSIAPTDFDGDGDTDFVVGTDSGLLLYTNNFPTRSLTVSILSAAFTGDARDIVVADLDGVGGPDVAAAVNGGPDSVFLSSAGYAPLALATPPGNGNLGETIAAGDVDGDGLVDLVVGHFPGIGMTGSDIVYGNTPLGFVVVQTLIKPMGVDTNDVVLFDMDEDGDLDLVAGSTLQVAGARTRLYQNVAGVFLSAISRITDNTGLPSEALAAFDVDLDLDPDIVIGYLTQSQIGLFPNHFWQEDTAPVVPSGGGVLTIDSHIKAGFSSGGTTQTWITFSPPVRPLVPGPFGYSAIDPNTWVPLNAVLNNVGTGFARLQLNYPPLAIGTRFWLQSVLFDGFVVRASNITETVAR